MRTELRKFYKLFVDLLLPNRCPCCNCFIRWDKLICDDCISKIRLTEDKVCCKCGKSDCMCNTGINYDKCITMAFYEGVIKDGIYSLKYKRGLNLAEYSADRLSAEISKRNLLDAIDMITCVPMTYGAKSERGYNQAYEFAKMISQRIGKPVYEKLLLKQYDNISQHSLSNDERQVAVKGLFDFNRKYDVRDKCVVLCDDVLTTGSTLNECSRILKENGAKSVFCVTIVTTRLKKQEN